MFCPVIERFIDLVSSILVTIKNLLAHNYFSFAEPIKTKIPFQFFFFFVAFPPRFGKFWVLTRTIHRILTCTMAKAGCATNALLYILVQFWVRPQINPLLTKIIRAISDRFCVYLKASLSYSKPII